MVYQDRITGGQKDTGMTAWGWMLRSSVELSGVWWFGDVVYELGSLKFVAFASAH